MSEKGFRLSLRFDRDDAEFVYGFEVASIWHDLLANPDELIGAYLHSQNIEMAMRMGEATRRKVDSLELPDNWLWARFHPAGSLDDQTFASDEPFPAFSTGDEEDWA